MNMVNLVTLDLIKQAMYAITEKTIVKQGLKQSVDTINWQPTPSEETNHPVEEIEEVPEENPVEFQGGADVPTVEDSILDERLTEEGLEASEEGGKESQPMVVTRAGRRITKPSRYLQVMKVSRKDWKSDALDRVITAEWNMLF